MEKLQSVTTYYAKEHFWSKPRVKSQYTINDKGEKHGTYLKYDYDNPGYIKYKVDFKHGKPLVESFIYPNGRIESTINHIKGIEQSFDEQGNLRYQRSAKKAVRYDKEGTPLPILY